MSQRQNHAPVDDRSARRIAFVQACWHKEIVDRCRVSFAAEIAKHGFGEADIDFFEVPGSLEIPLHALLLAESGRYAAIVAAGFVVDGGIYRHEFVADAGDQRADAGAAGHQGTGHLGRADAAALPRARRA